MSGDIHITILVENRVSQKGLRAEHGLAFHISIDRRQVLFDTGQTGLLVENARSLGIDLGEVDTIVLSHGHYDHTGGVAALRRLAPRARIVMHSAAGESKYAAEADGTSRNIGMGEEALGALSHAQVDLCDDLPVEVAPGLYATGRIPRTNEFEDVGGRFYLDSACTRPDPLNDDQALFFESSQGTVVLLGCAHAGIVNTIRHIESLQPTRKFACVLGGMHLLNASDERMRFTLEELGRRDVAQLVPMHCTGLSAILRLWETFPDRCQEGNVGTVFSFRS